ncbi:predicted protein [Chaetomium globosum CBS 148.51]|uniref:Uncharacterized protein n=1 Tax=Chaetomium globosum (strain ATCC 6205 / CBS 148.51 / DSM 1962 / NBRC 6347 / NRRL 1970) TaxID=306901 RepID=Q2H810_CHAGB|nr:uncharacterized protein CHGG_03644 [Chaetomium globosum CBS 148.51]EAQ91709.1 predicted protein [Chaetomium globosum CBS 148.51]
MEGGSLESSVLSPRLPALSQHPFISSLLHPTAPSEPPIHTEQKSTETASRWGAQEHKASPCPGPTERNARSNQACGASATTSCNLVERDPTHPSHKLKNDTSRQQPSPYLDVSLRAIPRTFPRCGEQSSNAADLQPVGRLAGHCHGGPTSPMPLAAPRVPRRFELARCFTDPPQRRRGREP